jgi:hypothetical protein
MNLFADPELSKVFVNGQLADSPLHSLGSLKHVPAIIALGAADGTIAPIHGRTIAAEMLREGLEPELMVFDGKGDRFDDDKRRPGADYADMQAFEDLQSASLRVQDPDEIEFVLTDELISDGAWWVDELRRWDRYKPGRFNVVRDTEDRTLAITSENISGVVLEPGMIGQDEQDWVITWNGREVFPAQRGVQLAFAPDMLPPELDPPLPDGAMKYALMRPFVIVPGTTGSAEDNELYLDIARAEAARWLVKGNGRVRVILDKDLTDAERAADVNLYVIGATSGNSVLDELLPNTPFHVFDGRVAFNAIDYGEDKGSRFVWPRIGGPGTVPPSNLYLTGTDAEAVKWAFSFDLMAPDRCLPHYLIVDKDTPWRGWEGLVEAGYYF